MKKVILIVILSGIFLPNLFPQENKNNQSKFGFGVSLFNLSEYLNESAFGNSIYLTINTKNNFRLEPTIGFSINESKNKYHLGLGLFKKKDLTNFELLAGIRLGLADGNVYFVAPTVGGEYYFDRHFSLGSEIQLRGTFEKGDFKLLSNTAVLLRFYF